MRSTPFTFPLATSVLIHMAALASVPHLITLSDRSLSSELIPIEVVITTPTAAPAPPSPPPHKEAAKPKAPEHITPPRIIGQSTIKLAAPGSTLPPIEEPLPSSRVEVPMEYPHEVKQLLPGPPPPPEPAAPAKPEPGPLLPLPAINAEGHRGNVLGPTAQRNSAAPMEGGEAGAGGLYAKGDVAVTPGTGNGGGGGGAGRSGLGLGRTGIGEQVAGINPGSGLQGPGGGVGGHGRLAQPRGGYQVTPHYPESARRAGIQGVTLLRFEIRTDGTVGKIMVERSAGHRDLDLTAAEAVKRWRFDPARRGNQPIAVWVTLPVRFELR